MQGLELTREYATKVALPELRRGLGDEAFSRIAVGSVGDGSDRFGFDDDVSRDHDWGVSLCVWACDGEQTLAASADQIMRALPSNYCLSHLGISCSGSSREGRCLDRGNSLRVLYGMPRGPVHACRVGTYARARPRGSHERRRFLRWTGRFFAYTQALAFGIPRCRAATAHRAAMHGLCSSGPVQPGACCGSWRRSWLLLGLCACRRGRMPACARTVASLLPVLQMGPYLVRTLLRRAGPCRCGASARCRVVYGRAWNLQRARPPKRA